MSRRTLILPIGAGVIGQDDVPLVRIMDSDETPTSITIYGVVDTVQPVESVTWTVNGVEQTGDVSRSPVLELTDLQPETSYAITLRATNINGQSQASARTIWTKKITTITPADVIDGVSYYDYQDVYRTGTMPERDETDITVSGRDVTVPAGHYAESETVSVSSEYIIPTGTKNINTNGTEDVTQYANVNVNVPASAVDTGTKQTNITTNGTQTVDVVGYANNEITVNVPASAVDSGTKQITSNGNGQDVVGYANVDVNVQPNTGYLLATRNGFYHASQDGYDGYDTVDVSLPQPIYQQLTANQYDMTYRAQDYGVDGFNEVYVDIQQPTYQRLYLHPETFNQDIEAQRDYQCDGFDKVHIEAMNLMHNKLITQNGTYNARIDDIVDGYESIDVQVQPNLYYPSNVTPTTSQQTVSIPSGYDGLDAVTVDAVTSSVDPNITAGNIKSGVTILGVQGTYSGGGGCTLTTLNVTPSTTSQTITPSGSDGWDEVNVDAVTSAIDANITAGNIRNGVSILGVQGTLEGGTPQNLTFTFADGTSGTYTFYAS